MLRAAPALSYDPFHSGILLLRHKRVALVFSPHAAEDTDDGDPPLKLRGRVPGLFVRLEQRPPVKVGEEEG
ncbi:hypothetical protein RRF57_010161 [Xylaria bambusicola]|uniref:Uncharacterized protein n=1 Tax=Xylaria bambusicola TaxID=326684 RepID=A0AAN7ZCP3_9PEZI